MEAPNEKPVGVPGMRLPPLRISVRRMMVAVAVIGLLFGVEIMRRRRVAYFAVASQAYRDELQFWRFDDNSEQIAIGAEKSADENLGKAIAQFGIVRSGPGEYKTHVGHYMEVARISREYAQKERNQAKKYRAAARYYAGLRLKYERAARMPWRRVDTDPPAPDWWAEEVQPEPSLPSLPAAPEKSLFDP